MRIPFRALSVGLAILSVLVVIGWIVARILGFAHLFLGHSGIPLTQEEALNAHQAGDSRPQLIPKIIHQVFHNWRQPGNETLPEDWSKVRQTCIDQNPGWDVKLWTEKASRDFIATEYAWFLRTYDGYRFKVQRVDAVRYFLLYHYGGIYLDLDNGCTANLEPLLYYPMWITDPGRGALSNNVLASSPRHPFWNYLTQMLYYYNYHYFFPYATISYASGQWFETAVWERYHALLPAPTPENVPAGQENRLHRLMMDDREGADRWIFFTQERGGTWINWDNLMFLWIGDHLILFLIMLFAVIGPSVWLCVRTVRRRFSGYSKLGYKQVEEHVA